jgi:hypothetical protein
MRVRDIPRPMSTSIGVDSGPLNPKARALDFETRRVIACARALAGLFAGLAVALSLQAALGERPIVSFEPVPGGFPVADGGRAAPLLADPNDWPGVIRVVRDLQADVERVCGVKPQVLLSLRPEPAVVIVGTLGRSSLVDRLVREKRIDVSGIRGGRESWLTQVVEHPFPGLDRALVIAGTDKRGTIYGAYDLSEQIGVSPWYWWADVPAASHERLFVSPAPQMHGPPAVRYRGIFLNDEAPDLTNWVRAKYGQAPSGRDPPVPEGTANYGHEFYARIFEVLLRLRANYLWPAMWNSAFNEDDPANAALADEYGIVMGTSHQEPMLRAQKEWDRRYGKALGHWNYARDPALLQDFWREGVRRNRLFESIYTLGLRGANDTEMAPGGPAANRAMLEGIVKTQREILRQEVNPDLAQIPQVWCLYKEVQDFYEGGMRVPDDVTLLWADDNWGNLRRLPKPGERARAGGAGIYYHFDYVGDPRNYKWVDTNPLPKVWDQLSLAAAYGADRLWIVNVGHFKGYERPMEFFMRMAWAPSRWGPDAADEFTGLWAEREFGPAHAPEIARLASRLARLNGRRKPEMLEPGTYSLVNYREAERVVEDYASLAAEARSLQARLPAAQQDAFIQMLAFPARATSVVNALYVAAGRNALYARQGRASAVAAAQEVRALFQADLELMAFYNSSFAGGRWAHFMDQPHLGYTGWNDPPANTLDAIKLVEPQVSHGARLGVAIEGSALAWPGEEKTPVLPRFDSINRQRQYVEVFNRGDVAFDYTLRPSDPWIIVKEAEGTAGPADKRHLVEIDWAAAPTGGRQGSLRITGAGESVDVAVETLKDPAVTRETVRGFVEDQGVVSIEPEHFSASTVQAHSRWTRIAGYGRTLSGMRAEGPADAAAAVPGVDAASLEYKFYLLDGGPVSVEAVIGPTLNFLPGRALRYAVAIDDEAPRLVTAVPGDFSLNAGRREWAKVVGDNARALVSTHRAARAGYHTLKVWAVDPGVVLQKLIIDLGGLRPSYLGPPESLFVRE